MINFDGLLKDLCRVPSPSGGERLVRRYIGEALTVAGVPVRRDGFGNLYAHRRGTRPGHILLCAHMDKVMPSARWAEVDAGASGLAELSERSGYLHGKFDDALGLAVIMECLLTPDPSKSVSLSALFTVREECGLQGAAYAAGSKWLHELAPQCILVIDTGGPVEPGRGLVLYENCGVYRYRRLADRPLSSADHKLQRRSQPLVRGLQRLGAQLDVPINTSNPNSNDAYVLARETAIPTVALEVPIRDMHAPVETVAKRDVELMRKFLAACIEGKIDND